MKNACYNKIVMGNNTETKKKGLGSNSLHFHRQKNYIRVLNTLINSSSPLSINDMARKVSISHPTAASIVKELHQKRLVSYTKTASVEVGRKPRLVEFCPEAGLLVGMDMGLDTYGIVTNLKGETILEKTADIHKHTIDPVQIANFIEELLPGGTDNHRSLMGIGVGIAGIVTKKGEYLNLKKGRQIPLKEILEERFGVPVVVENDANMMMLAEADAGVARGVDNAVYVMKTSSGIGLGILIKGEIYRGGNGFAGENQGIIPEDVFEKKGKAEEISQSFVDGISSLIYLFDPEVVILGGELSGMGDYFLKQLRARLTENETIASRKIRIEYARYDENKSIVTGVISSGIQKLFGFNL
jgi:predicted NBD/HSP70 family sugar kinase